MRGILFGFVFLPCAFAAVRIDAAPIKAEEPPVKAVTVPFELLKSGHMAIMVKINGQGPYRLIFDTGAPVNLLNNKIAKETGLLKGMQKPLFSPFGAMGEVKVKSLEVGDAKAEDFGIRAQRKNRSRQKRALDHRSGNCFQGIARLGAERRGALKSDKTEEGQHKTETQAAAGHAAEL